MKNTTEIEHERLCRSLECFLVGQGFNVEREVALPNGKGALDVYARSIDKPARIFEVKSSPASLSQGKIAKQIGKYRTYFPGSEVYIASPTYDGQNIVLLNSANSKRTLIPYI